MFLNLLIFINLNVFLIYGKLLSLYISKFQYYETFSNCEQISNFYFQKYYNASRYS